MTYREIDSEVCSQYKIKDIATHSFNIAKFASRL